MRPTPSPARSSPGSLPKLSGALSFNSATFAFEDAPDKPILKDINLDIRPGETMALVGITGSGKSAMLQLVPRLYDVTDGSVTIDGVDLREFAVEELRTVVAVAFEDTTLFSNSVRDNVLLGAPERSEEALEEALDVAQAHFAYSLPDGPGHAHRRRRPEPLRRAAAADRPGAGHRREAQGAGAG